MSSAEETCERCGEPIEETYCTHRTLCAECVYGCGDCQTEWAESRTYDDDRDEGL